MLSPGTNGASKPLLPNKEVYRDQSNYCDGNFENSIHDDDNTTEIENDANENNGELGDGVQKKRLYRGNAHLSPWSKHSFTKYFNSKYTKE